MSSAAFDISKKEVLEDLGAFRYGDTNFIHAEVVQYDGGLPKLSMRHFWVNDKGDVKPSKPKTWVSLPCLRAINEATTAGLKWFEDNPPPENPSGTTDVNRAMAALNKAMGK